MVFTILDTIHFTARNGNTFVKAACKGTSKSGSPYFFVASIPPEYADHVGEAVDLSVCFSRSGDAYVLPY